MQEDLIQHNLYLRFLEPKDYEGMVSLQLEGFGEKMEPYKRDQFLSQLKHFPKGQIGAFYDEKLVGYCISLILDLDEYHPHHSWEEISDDGYIRNHDPEGDTLYGIEVVVHPEYQNMKIGKRLYDARKDLCRELNLRRIMIGGRLPNYHKYKDEMDIYEYIHQVRTKKIFDPVLTFQLRNDFIVKRVIKNYLREDTDSCAYATLMEWANVEYEQSPARFSVKSQPVRLCCVQYQMRKISSFEEFATQVEYFVNVASEYSSDFVMLPELFTTQLLSFEEEKRPGLAARRLSEYTDDYIELFTQMALKYNVNIVAGSHFVLEEDHIFNVSFLFHRNGAVDRQYKLHVTPDEGLWWGVQPGSVPKVFDTDKGKVAINVCYDVEFPELGRYAVESGAQILFVPFCTDERHGFTRVRTCAQARAIENQIYVAIAGTTGNIPSVKNMAIQYAQSAIFTPSDFSFSRDGIAAQADQNAEMVVIADLDLEVQRRSRYRGTVMPLRDRRNDLYNIEFNELDEHSKIHGPAKDLSVRPDQNEEPDFKDNHSP